MKREESWRNIDCNSVWSGKDSSVNQLYSESESLGASVGILGRHATAIISIKVLEDGYLEVFENVFKEKPKNLLVLCRRKKDQDGRMVSLISLNLLKGKPVFNLWLPISQLVERFQTK